MRERNDGLRRQRRDNISEPLWHFSISPVLQMRLRDLLADPAWDAPFFKRLANNDTGQAAGHQGGMVLPKDLRSYLPILSESTTSSAAPTTDRYLRAEMFIGTSQVASQPVRYQLQTWGGTRSAESRITEGLAPVRNPAVEGDLLLFQRRADALDRFRLVLVQRASSLYGEVEVFAKGRRWGPLDLSNPPVSQEQLTSASAEIDKLADLPFVVMKTEIERKETRQLKIARSAAFGLKVRSEYSYRCAVSGIDIGTPKSLFEVEAAHIVPVSVGGTDDLRNGLALCQTIHWAFDRGLIGILPDRTIHLPRQVSQATGNSFIRQFHRKSISESKSQRNRPHDDALAWHLKNIVGRWE